MLLKDIQNQWQDRLSEPQREALWLHLTRPNGLWLTACQEVIEPHQDNLDEVKTLLQDWLNCVGKDTAAGYCMNTYSLEHQSSNLYTLFQSTLLVLDHGSSIPPEEFTTLASNANLSPGHLADLHLYLRNQELRPSQQQCTLIALLVDKELNGIPTALTLELLREGTGTFYPTPSLTLCRDSAFMNAEINACCNYKDALTNYDVRWRLERLDGKDLGHLTGASMGAAFALGLKCLLEPSDEIKELELDCVGISACVEPDHSLNPVGELWNKLDREAMTLANLHSLVVSNEQHDVPPRYASENASPHVIKADNIHHAFEQLSIYTRPRRDIRNYERGECEYLEFRLPGTRAPVESHYQILPLFRVTTSAASNETSSAKSSQPCLDIAELQNWEDTILHQDRQYTPVTLDQILCNTGSSSEKDKRPANQFVILGSPGCGKTTLLVYLAWLATTTQLFNKTLIPARIRLPAWEKWDRAHPESALFNYLEAHYTKLVEDAPSARYWRNWLQQGDVLLLLDGLDEINDEGWLIKKQKELQYYVTTPIITTCRTVHFEQYKDHVTDFSVHWLGPLNDKQRDYYINNYPAKHGFDCNQLIQSLSNIDTLRRLSLNPLVLSIICHSVDDKKNKTIPASRSALYHKLVERMLSRPQRVDVHYPAEPPTLDDKIAILSHTALQLFANEQLAFTEQELIQAIVSALKHTGYDDAKPWVNALIKDYTANSGFLRGHKRSSEYSETPYFFIHLTIQEYLSAQALRFIIDMEVRKIVLAGKEWLAQDFIDQVISKEKRWGEVSQMFSELT